MLAATKQDKCVSGRTCDTGYVMLDRHVSSCDDKSLPKTTYVTRSVISINMVDAEKQCVTQGLYPWALARCWLACCIRKLIVSVHDVIVLDASIFRNEFTV